MVASLITPTLTQLYSPRKTGVKMGLRCEFTPLDMSMDYFIYLKDVTVDYFIYIKNFTVDYPIYLKDLMVDYVNKTVIPLAEYVVGATFAYAKQEYKFVSIVFLLLLILYMFRFVNPTPSIIQRSAGDKWYHNISSDDEKRVKRVYSGGYAIMSCKNCEETAVYGSLRGGVPEACFDHRSSDMVKVFGCSVDSCKKKCVRGGLYCKGHVMT